MFYVFVALLVSFFVDVLWAMALGVQMAINTLKISKQMSQMNVKIKKPYFYWVSSESCKLFLKRANEACSTNQDICQMIDKTYRLIQLSQLSRYIAITLLLLVGVSFALK